MLKGDRNGLLPTLQAFADVTNNGLSGVVNPLYNGLQRRSQSLLRRRQSATCLAQFSAATSPTIPPVSHSPFPFATGRRRPIRHRRIEPAPVAITAAALRQPGAGGREDRRDRPAAGARPLPDGRGYPGTCRAEPERRTEALPVRRLTVALVIQAQNDLAADQDAEVQAMANYTHARIAFDQALGRTLDVNHVSMDEAVSGTVHRESVLPANLPTPVRQEVRR